MTRTPARAAAALALLLATAAGAQVPPAPAPAPPPAPAGVPTRGSTDANANENPQLQASIAVARLFSTTAPLGFYGNYAYLTLATAAGRTQNVYFGGSVIGPAAAQVRLIFSWAVRLMPPIEPALALRLLRENDSGLPYGYWALMGKAGEGPQTIAYVVEVAANAPASAIQEIAANVARRADALEAELSGKDVY